MSEINRKKLIVSTLLDNNTYSKKCTKIVDELVKCIEKEYSHLGGIEILENKLVKNGEILFCKNCKTCFKTHRCILDEFDNMLISKNDLKLSDLFIIATPVYEKNVSAFIKAFLDRTGYWCHTMEMLGKKCVIVVTGKFSGIENVYNYLYEICSFMGFNVIAVISDNCLKTPKTLSSEIDFVAKRIFETDIAKTINTSNYLLDQIYKNYKMIFFNSKDKSFETIYWKNSEYIDTYEDFCKSVIENKLLDII